jgi:hypothetical protein
MKTNRFIKIALAGFISCLTFIVQAQPTWSFDSHEYLYSMTITGKLHFEGSDSEDVNDMVGAFINGECRGFTNVKYIPAVNGYFVFLMVYSNSPIDDVTFRVFDKSENLEISAKESTKFSVNGNLGTSLNPFMITAANVNVAPTGIYLSNIVTPALAAANTSIATINAVDPNVGDSHTFSLQLGNGTNDLDNWRFIIDGNKLKSKGEIYFRKGDVFNVLIKAADQGGASVTIPLSVATKDEAILSSEKQLLSFAINQQVGATIFTGTDVFVTQHWSANLAAVVATFTISPYAKAFINYIEKAGGSTSIDFTQPVSFIVEAADKSSTTYTIHIAISNDIPSDLLLSNSKVDENMGSALVGNFSTVSENPNESHVYSLIEEPGTDYALFKTEGDKLMTALALDYETRSAYLIKARADDQKGGTVDKLFTISLIDKNDAPTNITLSQNTFDPNSPANTIIGELTAEDQDAGDSHVFSLVTGNAVNDDGNSLVKINGNKLLLASPFNDPSKSSWNILVRVTDKLGAGYEKSLTLKTQDSNQLPVFMSKPANFVMQNDVYVYAIEAIDKDGDPVSISFENLPGWITFYPDLNLLSGSPGNNEVGTHNFTVIGSDTESSVSQKITLMVFNINDPPEINYFLSDQVFVTNKANQFVIPADCFVDPDVGDKLSYSVSMGNNSAIPAWLTFDPITRTLKGTPPNQSAGIHQIKLVASDQKLAKEWMVFNLNVTFPTAISEIGKTENFIVYPNPFADIIHLNFPESLNHSKLKVRLTDANGRIVKNVEPIEANSKSINLGDLPSGIYFVIIQSDKSIFTEKIIKR